MQNFSTSSKLTHWSLSMLFILMMAAAGASQTGCAEATADSAASSDDCECGEFGGECVPCADAGPLMLPPPGTDAGTFLNQGNIDALNALFLNQEGSGPRKFMSTKQDPTTKSACAS